MILLLNPSAFFADSHNLSHLEEAYDKNFNLGDFGEREIHNLTIRIRSGSYSEFGWQLTQLEIGYTALHVEVDWMEEYEPPMEIFGTIGNYFENNGYERLQFHTNSAPLPVDQITDGDDLIDYSWGNRDISVMNTLDYDNSRDSPLYSRFWWNGDGRWWDLRVVKSFPDSQVVKPTSEVIV